MFDFFNVRSRRPSCAKRLERRFGSAHQSTQLIRLERKCQIRAAVGAPQGEMLLDHAGAERHGGDCHFDAEGVIGEPDRAAEFRCQLRNAPQIRLLDRRWISTHAVEQNQIAAAGRAESFNQFTDLLEARHAGRHYNRLAGRCDTLNQWNIKQLE